MGTFVTKAAGTPVIAELSVETVLAFSGCYFFREAFHGGVPDTETGELRHGAAVLLTVACALSALSGVTVFGEVSIGRFLAVTLLMACAMAKITPPKYVKQVLLGLQAREHRAYLVGGCVRDMILGIAPNDWDICTSALPEEVMPFLFLMRNFRTGVPSAVPKRFFSIIIGGLRIFSAAAYNAPPRGAR